jgi:tRNA threonylcarbamoyladenosine biosynthesis protein TsaE
MPDGATALRRLVTEDELAAAGEQVGRSLGSGAVVWLEGELGAGKTTFAQAIVRGLGASDVASSPTYTLVHHYHGRRGPVYHIDCYRLRSPEDASDLDWEALGAADALLVEWPERGGAWIPRATHRYRLHHVDDPERRELESL